MKIERVLGPDNLPFLPGKSTDKKTSVTLNFQEIAKQIADRDVSVRNAALNAATEAYFKVG